MKSNALFSCSVLVMVAVLLFALLMASCAPAGISDFDGTPYVRSTRDVSRMVTPTPTPPPLTELEEACKTYMDADLARSYQRFTYEIFWTFHTNFLVSASDPDVRLGCLRYYWRDEVNRAFTGTLESAKVISCEVENGIVETIDTDPINPSIPGISSSAGQRAFNDATMPQRMAAFTENARLACPLNISQMLLEVSSRPGFTQHFASQLPTVNMTEVFEAINETVGRSTWDYGEFSAVGAIRDHQNLDNNPLPIFFYDPQPQSRQDLTRDERTTRQIEFSLALSDPNLGPQFVTRLGGIDYPSSRLAISPTTCVLSSPPATYAWVEFGQCAKPWPWSACPSDEGAYLDFLHREAVDSLQPPAIQSHPLVVCQIEPTSVPITTIPFWTGPATLYVGYNPETKVSFEGEMFEGWFDPDSSTISPD